MGVMTLEDIDFLTSDSGNRLLERLAHDDLSDAHTLPLITKLRREYTPEQTRAALEMARLRLKAADKFGEDAPRLFFTREALEQASDPLVRHYRAGQINRLQVVDACCGIGADSIAMAQAGADVTGLDLDAVRVEIARCNAAALGLSSRFEVADVRKGVPPCDAAFFDPARRDEQGKRIFDVERYQPPLSTIKTWNASQTVVKLSPGVDLAQLEAYGGLVEFISVDGDLKEAVLWLGYGSNGLKATLLTNHDAYHWQAAPDSSEARLSDPLAWLIEPDPALLRAGLVKQAALEWDAYQLDDTIAYLTADSLPSDQVWLRGWKIRDWMPFQLKRLRAYLRERGVGRVTVKKRGSAITPEELTAGLKLKGSESCTLVLTRLRGQQVVLICDDAYGTMYTK